MGFLFCGTHCSSPVTLWFDIEKIATEIIFAAILCEKIFKYM